MHNFAFGLTEYCTEAELASSSELGLKLLIILAFIVMLEILLSIFLPIKEARSRLKRILLTLFLLVPFTLYVGAIIMLSIVPLCE